MRSATRMRQTPRMSTEMCCRSQQVAWRRAHVVTHLLARQQRRHYGGGGGGLIMQVMRLLLLVCVRWTQRTSHPSCFAEPLLRASYCSDDRAPNCWTPPRGHPGNNAFLFCYNNNNNNIFLSNSFFLSTILLGPTVVLVVVP